MIAPVLVFLATLIAVSLLMGRKGEDNLWAAYIAAGVITALVCIATRGAPQ
jgi:branched-subunit amino acid transport protein